MDFLLRNATVINEGDTYQANIRLSDGIISEIDRSLSVSGGDNCRVVDLTGLIVMPGVIDDQVHFRDPGFTYKADIFSESKAAVAGGVTSFMDMPNTNPQTVSCKLLEDKYNCAAGRSFANYAFYLGATNDNIDEIRSVNPTVTPGIKVFMGSSTGNMLVDNDETLENIFSQSPVLIAVHAEDETTIKKNIEDVKLKYGDNPLVMVHPMIRTAEACYLSSSKAVNFAKKFNSRLHILHLTTEKEMSLLESGDIENKKITAEVCIPHLWFDSKWYSIKGNLIKCNPAIKSENDKLALRQALNDGKLDVVATDHAPHTLDEKKRPYFLAPSGMPSIQHSLLAMIELSKHNVFPIEKIPFWMSHNPAKCFKVNNRGFIREGYAGDIVVVDLYENTKVDKGTYFYKCGWSPFDGMTFSSRIRYTFVNSEMVFDGINITDVPKGQRIYFN